MSATFTRRNLVFSAAAGGLGLGVARLALLTLSFGQMAQRLGLTRLAVDPTELPPGEPAAGLVGWAVQAAARRTPWDSACLAQALTATWMLKRRGGSGVLYLGVRQEIGERKEFQAHAWLRSGPRIVTGAAGHELYQVIARFGWCQTAA